MVKSGQSLAGIYDPLDTSGALTTDSSVSGSVYVNGVASAAVVNITGSSAPYKWSVTLPVLAAGDFVQVRIATTIGTTATAAVVFQDIASDLPWLTPFAGAVNDTDATATTFKTNLPGVSSYFRKGCTLVWTSGALAGQSDVVRVDSTGTFTMLNGFSNAPGNGDTFVLLTPAASRKLVDVLYAGIGGDNKVVLSSTQDAYAPLTTIDTNAIAEAVSAQGISVDLSTLTAVLNAIQAKTNLLGTVPLTVTSPLAANGTITLVRGDDYRSRDGREITITLSNAPDLTGATVQLLIDSISPITGTASNDTVSFDIPKEITSLLTLRNYSYKLVATLANGDIVTLNTGRVQVSA